MQILCNLISQKDILYYMEWTHIWLEVIEAQTLANIQVSNNAEDTVEFHLTLPIVLMESYNH